ncbi:MAG: endonuclease III [Bacilli bacterium]|nr:endonuclease III [Bacilli bacterium]
MNKKDIPFLLEGLDTLFPDAHCELNFASPFQCIVAVSLSAQTTDASVNRVTPALFSRFPTSKEMANADIKEVEELIHSLGLYRNKARNLIALSKDIEERFGGELPKTKEELTSLSGVGIKTANVVLAECYKVPAIAVDTHVLRVSARLGLTKEGDSPETTERKLESLIPKERHIKSHHQLIFLGRRICHARGPECENCLLSSRCYFAGKKKSTKGK